MKYARIKLKQLTLLSLRRVLSLMKNSPTAEKALSASTDVGGIDSNAAVILVIFAVFSPVASKILNSSYAPANRPTFWGCFMDALCFFFYCSLQFHKQRC